MTKLPTRSQIMTDVDLTKISLRKCTDYQNEGKEYFAPEYDFDETLRDQFRAYLVEFFRQDFKKYFKTSRGNISMTPLGKSVALAFKPLYLEAVQDAISDAKSTTFGKLDIRVSITDWEAEGGYNGYKEYTAEIIAALTPEKDHFTVRQFLNNCGIQRYSIVQNSSRAIETNEASKMILGCFSPLLRKGVVAFLSHTDKVKGYTFDQNRGYQSSFYETKLDLCKDIVQIMTDPKYRIFIPNERLTTLFFPRFAQGGMIIGDNIFTINDGGDPRLMFREDGHYGLNVNSVKNLPENMNDETKIKLSAEADKVKDMILNFDKTLVVYKDDALMERLNMAATMEGV